MTKDELVNKIITLVETNNVFLGKVSEVLEDLNDQNKLHTEALNKNTEATMEMAKSFNKVWKIFYLAIGVLVVLAIAEKIKGLDYLFKFF